MLGRLLLLLLITLVGCGVGSPAAEQSNKQQFVRALGLEDSPMQCQWPGRLRCLRCDLVVDGHPAVFVCCDERPCRWRDP